MNPSRILILFFASTGVFSSQGMRQDIQKENPLQAGESAFETVPDELKSHISSFLVTAPGKNNEEQLNNSIKQIRALFSTSKKFKNFLTDVPLNEYFISQLAKRYQFSEVIIALRLNNPGADIWLANPVNKKNVEKVFFVELKNKKNKYPIRLLDLDQSLVNAQDESGNNPLIYATINKDAKSVAVLLSKGANTESKAKSIPRPAGATGEPKWIGTYTPLLIAIDNDSPEIVHLLINAGANVLRDAVNSKGEVVFPITLASPQRRSTHKIIVDAMRREAQKIDAEKSSQRKK